MALQIALATSVACLAFCAVSIFLASSSCVACANAMRATIRHAHATIESQLTSFCAHTVSITFLVVAIVWTILAYPAVLKKALERIAARNTRNRLASFTIAAFRTRAFWARFIAQVPTPPSIATIFAFAVVFATAATFAATRTRLVTFVSKEAVLA